MKNMICVLALVLTSCVGARVREQSLNPIAKAIWPNVRVDFDRGLADGLFEEDLSQEVHDTLVANANALTEALDSGDSVALAAIPWADQMAPWAIRGVSVALVAGELGPNGASILLQRVTNFSQVIAVLQGQSALPPVVVADNSRHNPYIIEPAERRMLDLFEIAQ